MLTTLIIPNSITLPQQQQTTQTTDKLYNKNKLNIINPIQPKTKISPTISTCLNSNTNNNNLTLQKISIVNTLLSNDLLDLTEYNIIKNNINTKLVTTLIFNFNYVNFNKDLLINKLKAFSLLLIENSKGFVTKLNDMIINNSSDTLFNTNIINNIKYITKNFKSQDLTYKEYFILAKLIMNNDKRYEIMYKDVICDNNNTNTNKNSNQIKNIHFKAQLKEFINEIISKEEILNNYMHLYPHFLSFLKEYNIIGCNIPGSSNNPSSYSPNNKTKNIRKAKKKKLMKMYKNGNYELLILMFNWEFGLIDYDRLSEMLNSLLK